MEKILVARASGNYQNLNNAFPSIFKSYLNKPFGPYKRITKDNILDFKKLLLKEHPILIQKAKEDETKIEEVSLRPKTIKPKIVNPEKEELIRQWKIAYPGISKKKYSLSFTNTTRILFRYRKKPFRKWS